MKDPIRYFIDEGFGHIYCFRNSDGILCGQVRWNTEFKNFIPTIQSGLIHLAGVNYITDDLFFAKYATEVESIEQAKELINYYNNEWFNIKNEVATIQFAK